MTAVVQEAPDGLALDTSTPITAEIAARIATTLLLGQKVIGVAQYVGLEDSGIGDITADRLAAILRAGLGLWLVQHALRPGWTASASLGRQLGTYARRNARRVGYLPGAHLALDLEGCSSTGEAVSDFVNAWTEAVIDDYPVLLYVGAACGLTREALYYALPQVRLYWSDWGPREVLTRGFAIRQHPPTTHCGIPVDPDTLQADGLSGRLRWMVDPSAMVA